MMRVGDYSRRVFRYQGLYLLHGPDGGGVLSDFDLFLVNESQRFQGPVVGVGPHKLGRLADGLQGLEYQRGCFGLWPCLRDGLTN